ncbi:unnamed protein product [Eruca vesicaria subsp. sativa]|uniref:ZF-HD dimerization-type domain-containing protein n=1 Tax=Eruca vesicaria subsp. sativa TaxID=29727 RepID=A0ABC8LVS7_ERUVS|nr:unnamed protein product [Eruca vesicaria subsp. sativa]
MNSSSQPNQPSTTNNKDCSQNKVFLYNECLKNQAVSFGGYALDGCASQTLHPLSVMHVCHRNFHRRDPSNVVSHHTTSTPLQPVASTQHLVLSLSSSGFSRPSDQEKGKITVDREKKRKRTKFTAKQKLMMRGFAERAGWKINGCDDKCVREFCNEVGIKRGVLKVWIQNNKNFANVKNSDTTSSIFQKL